MTKPEKIAAVTKALDYLIAEGMVVKEGNNYRLKTEKELELELYNVLNEN